MSKASKIRTRWLHYLMDVLLVTLIVMWMNAGFDPGVWMPIIIVMILGGIVMELLLPRIRIVLGKVIFFIPIIGMVGWLFELEWFLILIVAVISTWRFTSHFLDPDLGQEGYVFLLSVTAISVFFILYRLNGALGVMLILTLIQFILMLAIRLNRIISHQGTRPAVRRYMIYTAIGFIGITGITAALFTYIKEAFMWVMSAVVSALAMVFYYPIHAFFQWIESMNDGELEELSRKQEEEEVSQELLNQKDFQGSTFTDWIDTILICLLVLLVIWVLYKLYKKHLEIRSELTLSPAMEAYGVVDNEVEQQNRIRGRAPDNRIRKRLYQLERKMAKYEYGRYKFESVHDWLDRIDPPDDLYQNIAEVYQRVRYGEQDVDDDEAKTYETAIQQLTSWGKEKYKKNKNKSHP